MVTSVDVIGVDTPSTRYDVGDAGIEREVVAGHPLAVGDRVRP